MNRSATFRCIPSIALLVAFASGAHAAGFLLVSHDRRIESSAFAANAEDSESQSMHQVAPDDGPFDAFVSSFAGVEGAGCEGSGAQNSTVTQHTIEAYGSEFAFAQRVGDETTAYAHGASNVALRFSLDAAADYSFGGFVEAAGEGFTSVALSRPFQTIYFFSTSSAPRVDFAEQGTLQPGTYDLNVHSTGTIALGEVGTGLASGGYELHFLLDSATGAPVVASSAPLAFPNPFTNETRLVVPDGAGPLRIVDLTGRVVRSLPAGVSFTWDGRDESGCDLSSGVYWMRAEGGAAPAPVKIVRVR